MSYQDKVESALSREQLDELKPGNEEMFENTRRATTWYNEAVWTAARIFVEAAEESDEFREPFVSNEQKEKEVDWGEGTETIEVDAWRDVMQEEVPEYHEQVMGIGLSAFQGGNAEKVARRVLEDDSKELSRDSTNN